LLGGRPLIAWTIAAAIESGIFQRVLVTTDDGEIAAAARAAGAEVPFLRPPELALDGVPNQAAVDHAVAWLAQHDRYVPEAVCILQPSSPLRSAEDIRAAVRLLESSGAACVESVAPADAPPHLLRQLEASGRLTAWRASPPPPVASGERLPIYTLNGAIYLTRHPLPPSPGASQALVMPRDHSLDIDDAWDLRLAEAVLHLCKP
jgi:CMP-N-acetylneuraminic acid synthetase